MEQKIGIIASDEELKNSIIELYKEDVDKGEIMIDLLDPTKMADQGKILENKGAKAIIARSGGYKLTLGTVNVPMIHLKVTTMDILHAIRIAKSYNKEIVLIIADIEYFDYNEWMDLINAEITVEKYISKEEIENIVKSYVHKKDHVVIVGSGIPCSLARKLGMDNVFINASKESIREGITYAKELVEGIYRQKYDSEVLRTVLDGVHDAVVAIDHEGKVILYNKRAKKLLDKDSNLVMGNILLDVIPELDFVMDVLESKIDKYNEIKKINNIVIAVNTSILNIEGNILGVLCSFQDITRLQNLEKKIRYELNKKGHIARYNFHDIISFDPDMKLSIAKAIRVSNNDSTVIIYGESGTGKELFAQSMHNLSERKDAPFVAVNCAALTESLLESELFGYEEGSFTGARKGGKIGLFELAHGGTIFLDEINSITPNLQAKLLRVLEEKEIMRIGSDYVIPLDVRIIAAANEILKKKVEDGSFRKDLFYRLNVLEIHLPSLRERKMDIIPLFKHYLQELSKNAEVADINKDIEERLISYSWPGNVRELRNIAQRYLLFQEIDLDENTLIEEEISQVNDVPKEFKEIDLKEINHYVEEKVIEMLSQQGMKKAEIAKLLGISRTALWKKSKTYHEE